VSDRELLELAAKAAGIKCDSEGPYVERPVMQSEFGKGNWIENIRFNWNPIISDAEAFRLMVALGMDAMFSPEDVEVIATQHADGDFVSPWAVESWTLKPQDTYAATRRAIVRAAAEIGRGMK
jgi:hypothetical protein